MWCRSGMCENAKYLVLLRHENGYSLILKLDHRKYIFVHTVFDMIRPKIFESADF